MDAMLIYVSLTLITWEQSPVWHTHRSMLFDYWGNKIECVILWLLLQVGNSGSYRWRLSVAKKTNRGLSYCEKTAWWKTWNSNHYCMKKIIPGQQEGNKNCAFPRTCLMRKQKLKNRGNGNACILDKNFSQTSQKWFYAHMKWLLQTIR